MEIAATPLHAALDAFAAAWNSYDRGIVSVTSIHLYLSIIYIDDKGLESIQVLGDRIFGKVLIQHLRGSRFSDVGLHGFAFGLLSNLSGKNTFVSREARMYDAVTHFVMRRAIKAGAKLRALEPDAALDVLPDTWDAYNRDVHEVDRFVLQVENLSKYIESEGIESTKSLGKRFFIDETSFREPDMLDCWQNRMLAALLSGSLATDADAKTGPILLQLCEPSSALYISHVEVPLRKAAADFYHETAVKDLSERGSDGFEESMRGWLRMERDRAEMCIFEQNREDYVRSISDRLQLAKKSFQFPSDRCILA